MLVLKFFIYYIVELVILKSYIFTLYVVIDFIVENFLRHPLSCLSSRSKFFELLKNFSKNRKMGKQISVNTRYQSITKNFFSHSYSTYSLSF